MSPKSGILCFYFSPCYCVLVIILIVMIDIGKQDNNPHYCNKNEYRYHNQYNFQYLHFPPQSTGTYLSR